VTLLLFGPALLGRGVFFQRDVLSYWRPQVDSLTRVLAEGAPPVWNPYFETGLPLLADPGYQVYYPPQWANLVMPPDLFYAFFIAGHAFLAAAGAFALGRAWGLGPAAASMFGAAWLLSGPFQSLGANNPQFAGAAWIPWVLLALEWTLTLPTARRAAVMGAAAALQLLAGSGDFALMTAQLCALRFLLWIARGPGLLRDRASTAARVAPIAGVFALALGAALWMPTLAIVRGSGRAHMDPSLSAYWSVHPATLADLFVPTAVAGLPLTATARETFFEGREPFLPSLYLGIAAAALAALGLRASRLRGLLLLVLAGALTATAIGRHGVVHAWVLRLPAASLFRYPVKYLVPAAFFWAALAGFGMAAFQEKWSPGRQRAVRVLGGAALVIAAALAMCARAVVAHPERLASLAVDLPTAAAVLATRLAHSATALGLGAAALLARSRSVRAPAALTAAMLLLVIGDLLLAARGLNPLAPPRLMQHRPALLQSLGPRPDGFPTRVLSLEGAGANQRVARGPLGWDREWSFGLGLLDQISPATAARWGLGGAYDGDFTGLAPPALSAYSGVVRHPRAGRLALNLLRAGGIDYVVSLDRTLDGLTEVASVPSVYDAPVRLFRVPEPASRVYLARARVAIADYKAWEEMAEPSFEPGREIVLIGDAPAEGAAPPPVPAAPGRVVVTERRADRVDLEVDSPAPTYAVLAETCAKGWTAEVDGADAAIRTANLLFCAAAVPAGRHRVVFEYRAPGARAGLVTSALGLAALTAVLRRRRGRGLPSPGASATIARP
jgi:hypothetical protein